MSATFENNLPRRLRYGRGISTQLPAELKRLSCTSPLVVTDRGVRAAGLLDRILAALVQDGTAHRVFDATEPEPPFACVEAAAAAARAPGFTADCVVALGGGSVMDTAKLVAATLRDGRAAPSLAGIGKVGSRSLPLLCIPTTSGTGSEATPVAIFTDPATGVKVGVVDACLVPDVVLLDPALTDGLPPLPTAAAGMDALVHALEAYIARVATPIARGLALEAARRIGPALPAACRDGRDKAARDAMLLGANLAGIAFANSSCCGVHALALPLGGRFHIAHGIVTGSLVAETMRHNLPACREDFTRFSEALGWTNTAPERFPDRLAELARSIGLTAKLAETAVPNDALEGLARDAVANRRLMDPNPRAITQEDAVGIFRRTLDSRA